MKLPRKKKILFFSPHPDDDVISSAATLYTLAKNKNKIICVYLTTSPRGVLKALPKKERIRLRKEEAKKACKIIKTTPLFLDLPDPFPINQRNLNLIKELLKETKPHIVFVPNEEEKHPTHRSTNKIVLKALKGTKVKKILFYEVWTPIKKPSFIYYFNEDLLKIKKKAINQHKTQVTRINLTKAVTGLNAFRGILGKEVLGKFGSIYKDKKQYGEAFLIKKLKKK